MPSKFTPERRAIILEALRENPSIPSAASKAGIAANTLNTWLAKGQDSDPEYAAFALEAQEARRAMKDEVVAALYKTATDEMHPQQTKAAHMLLTNLYPMEFSNVRHVVSHKQQDDPRLDLSALPTGDLRELHRLLKKARAADEAAQAQALPAPIEVLEVGSESKPAPDPKAN